MSHEFQEEREKQLQRAIVLQLVDYLQLQFTDCIKCDGTGEAHGLIPICQDCHGIGRRLYNAGLYK